MRVTITVECTGDEITLYGSKADGFDGPWIEPDGIEGWFGTPQPREGVVSRYSTDGDMAPARLTQGARHVTVSGFAYFDSSVECSAFRDKLNALSLQSLVLAVEDALGRRWARGYVSSGPETKLDHDELSVSFSFVITCPDPRRYSDEVIYVPSGGRVRIVNVGNAPAFPRVEVTGQVTNLTMTLGSHVVKWTGSANGLSLDFSDMAPSAGTVTVDDAFSIPPGTSEVSVASDGEVRVMFSSAWR